MVRCSSISANHKEYTIISLISCMGINFEVNPDGWFIHRAWYPANTVLTDSLRLNAINLPFWVSLRHVIIYHIVKLLHYEKMRLTDFVFLILVSKENTASWSSEMRLIIVSTFVNLLWSIYTDYNTWNTLLVVYWG